MILFASKLLKELMNFHSLSPHFGMHSNKAELLAFVLIEAITSLYLYAFASIEAVENHLMFRNVNKISITVMFLS